MKGVIFINFRIILLILDNCSNFGSCWIKFCFYKLFVRVFVVWEIFFVIKFIRIKFWNNKELMVKIFVLNEVLRLIKIIKINLVVKMCMVILLLSWSIVIIFFRLNIWIVIDYNLGNKFFRRMKIILVKNIKYLLIVVVVFVFVFV